MADVWLILGGTIQGNPLSPLLFLIYIEPLLRWLHVWGRGYKLSSLGNTTDGEYTLKDIHQLAALGFIDDTTLFTRTREDMAIQQIQFLNTDSNKTRLWMTVSISVYNVLVTS